MPNAARDSGTPQAASEGQNAASAETDARDPQLLDIARLLDTKQAVPPADPPAADADPDEPAANDALSQLAERDDEDDDTKAQTDEAAEVETPADDDEEQDEVKPPRGLTPEAQHAFNKVVAKEKAKRKELEERLTTRESELAAEIERLRAENAGLLETVSTREEDTEAPHPMLAKAKTEAEVEQAVADAQKYAKWAARQLERLRYRPADVEAAMKAEGAKLEEFTEESMAEWLLRVKENAQDLIDVAPKARSRFERKSQFASQERILSEQAERLIPWLKNAKAPEMEVFNEVITQMPELKRRPNWKALVAAHVEGLKVIRARAEKVAAAKQPKARPAGPSAEPAPVDRVKASRAAAFSKVIESQGNINDVARLLG